MNFYRDDEFIVERNLSRGAKLLLIFMQIYGFEEEGGTRSRTKVLEGERSGRIVKRGARPLLNLLSTVSPLPFLRLARSPFSSPPSPPLSGENLDVSRRKTSSFQPVRMSPIPCLCTYTYSTSVLLCDEHNRRRDST